MMLAMMMMVGMTAKAQYTMVVDTKPTSGWVAGWQEFDAAPIVEALGLGSFTDLKELVANSTTGKENGIVYIKTEDGRTNVSMGNEGEVAWWMNMDCTPQHYGDEGSAWYVVLACEDAGTDEDTGESWPDAVSIVVGQMPGVFAQMYEPTSLQTTLYLVVGGKEVSFDVTQNVAPAQTMTLSSFEIVKDYELTISFVEGRYYEGKTFSADLDGLYEALGVEDAAAFDEDIASKTFTQAIKTEETAEGSGEYIHTPLDLLVDPNAAAPDRWFGRYTSYDEATDEETTLPMNYAKAWSDGCTFYLPEVTLADGKYSVVAGQFPGTLKEGDTDWTYLYIVNDSKAARLKVQVEVKKPEVIAFDQMTQAGEMTVPVKMEKGDGGWPYIDIAFDMTPVAEALGVDVSDLDEAWAWEADGSLSNRHTTDEAGGYYFDADGYIAGYSNASPIYMFPTDIYNGEWRFGQHAGSDFIFGATADTPWKAQLVFLGTDKYYIVNIDATITVAGAGDEDPDKTVDDEFGEIVATIPLTFEMKPAGSYYGDMSAEDKAAMELDLNIESIKSLLGEDSYNVWGLKAPAAAGGTPRLTAGTGYTPNTGFNSGFWMAMPQENLGDEYVNTAFVGSWNTNSYGIEWKLNDGIFGFDQIPGQRAVGEEFTSTFYWGLADKSKAIKYELTIKYVEEPNNSGNNATILASIDRMIEESEVENGYDMKAIVTEAFGIDEEEWESVVPKLANSAATYVTVEDGSSFVMRNGAIYNLTDGEAAPEDCYGLTYEDGAVELDPMDIPFADGDESKAVIRMAFDYTDAEGATGRVLLNITAVSKDSPLVGVSGINTNVDGKATYYTLQGTPLTAPVKGICIKKQGGKTEVIYVK